MRASHRMTWSAALAVAIAGCGGEPAPLPEYPTADKGQEEQESDDLLGGGSEQQSSAGGESGTLPPPPVQVVAAQRTPIEGSTPRLKVLRPKDGQRVSGDSVKLRARVRGWDLAPAPGKHVHVIVDNEPYIAVRDLSGNVDLNAIYEEAHGKALEKGTHVLRIFPSRKQHESVKQGTPFEVVVFHYKKKSKSFSFDPKAPLLTYSRPKGCNPAGKRVLLDFYLSNVDELSAEGWRVRYDIDDGEVSGDITQWQPHYIENLPEGEHSITLELVTPEGEVAEGPYNSTTRTIRVATDC